MAKKPQNIVKTSGKTAGKAADGDKTGPKVKMQEEAKVPEGFRQFTLPDVLQVLADIRLDLAKQSLMSGVRSAGHSITIGELQSGLVEIPVQSRKDAKKES